MNTRSLLTAAVAVSTLAGAAFGQLGYAGGTYTNTFDSLAASGNANPWTNNSTFTGWFLFGYAATAIADYNANDGASNSGHFYSYGSAGSAGSGPSTERALGGLASGNAYFGTPTPASGAVAGYIAFAITNNTGGVLTDAGISFDGEQWRNGGNTSAQTMVLEYGFGATFAAVTTWIAPGGNFDWASPVVGATAAAVDGNAAGLVANRGGTISNLTWNNGDTMWVRWIERNDAGNDHGLAIDRFNFSATPTPGAAALLGLGGLAFGRRRR